MNTFRFVCKICASVFVVVAPSLFLSCTDHKTTIPFDFPEYKPRLVVLASIGTLSGGEVAMSWSKPLQGQAGVVPALPVAEVSLLESRERIASFIAHPDSAGYYTLAANEIDLEQGKSYVLEIVLPHSGERIRSETCYLPQKSDLQHVQVDVEPATPFWMDIQWTQGTATEGVGATALHPYLLDANGDYVVTPALGAYYLSTELRFTDGNALPERSARMRFSRYIPHQKDIPARAVDIRLAFLSPELALFKREVDQLGRFGESVFQTVRPLYSNMIGAVGVFGLYHESAVRIDFED